MIRLIRSELIKVRTTSVVWWLLALLIPYTALNAFIQFAQFEYQPRSGPNGNSSLPLLDSPEAIRSVLSGALSAKTMVLLLGILLVTTEFRHMTVTPTFLSAPRRSEVVGAKLIASLPLGIIFAVVAIGVDIVTGFICYAFTPTSFTLNVPKVGQALLGIFVVIVVYTIIGIGLGTLIKNQIFAIIVALGWSLAVEKIGTGLLSLWSHGQDIYKFFPGNAATSVTGQYLGGGGNNGLLSTWQGLLVLIAYGIIFAALGAVITLRRDIT